MKKILTIALIVGFVFAGTAYADFYVDGNMEIIEMTIYEAELCKGDYCPQEVIRACELEIFFVHEGQEGIQEYFLEVKAYGNALNNALWVSRIVEEPLDARLRYSLLPYWVEIVKITAPFTPIVVPQ
jgi:hypothetical protein